MFILIVYTINQNSDLPCVVRNAVTTVCSFHFLYSFLGGDLYLKPPAVEKKCLCSLNLMVSFCPVLFKLCSVGYRVGGDPLGRPTLLLFYILGSS